MAYNPAGNLTTTATITHLASVYYERRALTPLRTTMKFWKLVDNRVLPLKNGKTVQFYRYSDFGANTVATTEGNIGTSLSMTSGTVSATVAQFADFISFSDLLVDTAIDNDIVAVGAEQLGYRGALSADGLIKAEIDGLAALIDVPLLGSYLSAADLANHRHRFAGLNILPFPNGFYPMLIHPYCSYDLIHDPSVGGFIDVAKQVGDQANVIFNPNVGNSPLMRINGVEVWESTNVTVTAGPPKTYRCYIAGQEAVAALDLAGRGPTRTQDQNSQRFKVYVNKSVGPSEANPEGKIKAFASYNFVFAAKNLDTSPYRVKKNDAQVSLGL